MYLWSVDDEYPESLIGKYDRERGPDRFSFKQGQPLATLPSQRPRFQFDGDEEELRSHHDLANNALVPLVSAELSRALNDVCPSDFQLIPAEIEGNNGVLLDYSILIATKKVRALDLDKSQYAYVPGTRRIMRIDDAVYHEAELGPCDLAREAEYLSHLLVSTRLFSAIRRFVGTGLLSIT